MPPPYNSALPPQLQALAQASPAYATALGLGPMLGSPLTAGSPMMQQQQNQMAQQPAAGMANPMMATQNAGWAGMPGASAGLPGQQPSPLVQALMAQQGGWGW